MDFRDKIIEAYDKSDWNLLVDLAIEVRKANSKESFFGLRKNYFNIIQGGHSYQEAKDVLHRLGFHVIGCATSQFIKKVKEGKVKVEDASKNIAIITKSDDMPGALAQLKFPYTYFDFREKDNSYERYEAKREGLEPPDKKSWYWIKNVETGEEYEFDDANINGLLRDEKIDSILEDI